MLVFLLTCLLEFLLAVEGTVTLSILVKLSWTGRDLVGVINQVAVQSEYCEKLESKMSAWGEEGWTEEWMVTAL